MIESDHIEGFKELLATSGVNLLLSGVSVPAVVSRNGGDPQEYDLLPGDCQNVFVMCFKKDIVKIYADEAGVPYTDSFGNLLASAAKYLPDVGAYFKDEDGGSYRIKGRLPMPSKPFVKYHCEYTGADDDE